MEHIVEVRFRLLGSEPFAADHGYQLYGAISRLIPEVHQPNGIAICPIAGRQIGDRQMVLTRNSWLRLRVPAEKVPVVIRLAGKELRLGNARLSVGTPQIQLLRPAPALRSRLVVIKPKEAPKAQLLTQELFRQSAQRQLEQLGIAPTTALEIGKRRTLKIKRREIVGYELTLRGLSEADSLVLLAQGLGGRRHMGCGVFVPLQEEDHDEPATAV